jgi:superfamily II DNA or RNA helicase
MTWHVVPGHEVAFTLTHMPEIPGAELQRKTIKGHPVTLAKHTYPTWKALRQHGVHLPSPVQHFEWPGRFVPMSHQRKTVEFLTAHDKCFCLNGLGTGKTLCGAWAAEYLLQQGAIRRVLIVAPLSICDHVWERELFKTLPHRKVAVLRGSRARKQAIARDMRITFLVVNPESLGLVAEHLPGVDLVLVDEFTKFKNARTQRWRVLRSITKHRRLWLFSGTPAPQGPLDAYGPIKLVRDERLSFGQWRDLTMVQVTPFKWVPKHGAEDQISQWMQPAVRFKREDCYDMPDVSTQTLEVDLTPEQRRAIEGFKKEAAAEFADKRVITAATAAAVLSKCLQVMAGGVYGEDEDGRYIQKIKADTFFETVEDVVDQADTPVVIFLPFRSSAQAVHDMLAKAGYRVDIIMGGVKNRSAIFDTFKHGGLDALVAVAGTMSHGVDGLQNVCRYVLWASPPYSFEEYDQANGRIVRNGQRNDVVIYHLVQNDLAKELFARLQSRARLQDTVLNLIGEHGE